MLITIHIAGLTYQIQLKGEDKNEFGAYLLDGGSFCDIGSYDNLLLAQEVIFRDALGRTNENISILIEDKRIIEKVMEGTNGTK